MNEILSYLKISNYNIESITSIASVCIVFLTMIITIIYVKATLKLVHIPYLAHVMIVKIDEKQQLVIKNKGPGIVLNLTAVICSKCRIRKLEPPSDHYDWNKYIKSELITELCTESTAITSKFEHIILSKIIELRWTSLTGKKYRKYYKYVDGRIGIRYASKFEIFILHLEKVKLYILKPYLFLRKVQYSQNRILIQKIIKILKVKGPLKIDYITDEINGTISLRTDLEVEKVVNKMVKKNIVINKNFNFTLRK